MKKPLSERVLIIPEEQGGGKIPFSSLGGQNRQIAESWEDGKDLEIQGLPTDRDVFSGDMLAVMSVIADFVSGDEDADGNILYGTAKKKPSIGFGDGNTIFCLKVK